MQYEKKNTLDRIHRKLDFSKEVTNELKDMTIKITQNEREREEEINRASVTTSRGLKCIKFTKEKGQKKF